MGRRKKVTVQFEHGIDSPPEWLDEYALKEWHRVTTELNNAGALLKVHYPSLIGYVTAYSQLIMALEDIRKNGMITKEKYHAAKKNPMLQIANEARSQIRAIAKEFGFTNVTQQAKRNEEETEDDEEYLKDI